MAKQKNCKSILICNTLFGYQKEVFILKKGSDYLKLTFIGAAHEVTGSCHFLQACGKNILIDYGMEQGRDTYINAKLPISESEVDYVFLTHAHIDHSGLLPLLYQRGFRGSIFTTSATTDLCDIMLRDSAHIQEMEAEWKNRKGKRSGAELVEPLYTMEDAIGVQTLFVPCNYNEMISVSDGIHIRFTDVGHLLGSASIEVWLQEEEGEKKLIFSGDIGNKNQPLIKDPQYLEDADYVIMESTYGDRYHEEVGDYIKQLVTIIRDTFQKGGNVVVPCFAVGRTQEMLYFIRQIKQDNLLPEFPNFEVWVDSPLAVEATNVFNKNYHECFDEEAMELIREGINPIRFPGLRLSVTSEESKAINFDEKPKVIISASGMCDAGRVRHHLKHNLWREECTIVFAGYQAIGSPGRAILDGIPEIRLFGETIQIRARIEKLDGVSGHADKEGLIQWITALKKKPQRVFIVHGEDEVCDSFARCLENEYGFRVNAPYSGDSYDLLMNTCVETGNKVYAEKKSSRKHANAVFERLLAAGQRLLIVIRHNEGGANKDLARFADQIQSLCDKWDR